MRLFFLFSLLLIAGSVSACAADAPVLFLNGEVRQGEMLFGFVSPDAELTVNDERISPRKDGWFAVGIGRDDEGTLKFKAVRNGTATERDYAIKPRKWKVQSIDGLPQNTVTPSPEEQKRIADEMEMARKAREKTVAAELPLCFDMPAEGRISSIYGSQRILNGVPKTPHNALDIANKEGTPIFAPADGVVVLVNENMFLSGKTVLIGHGQNVVTSYIHLSEIAVKEGQTVKKGDEIGKIGTTGRSTGPHLHWVVSWKTKRVDPQAFINNSQKFCPAASFGQTSALQKETR